MTQLFFFFLQNFTSSLQGCTFASSAEIFVHWAPPNEISRLMVNAYMGCAFGPAINYMLSGFIAHKWGWEAVFYVTG